MLCFKRFAALLAVAAGAAMGQPALTTIQDILYKADGTRFNGTMYLRWNSFQAGDTSNIATSSVTLRIVNGILSVKLVPTTTASAGAQYSVTYNSDGKTQFTETWAVPPSSTTLRVRDVRVSSGAVVGPSAVTSSPIQIGDVVGLSNALSVRPSQGIGFGPGRAAVINQAGQIDAAAGSLGDCVRVDGSSGPCGGGGGGVAPLYSDAEIPSGAINGANVVFTLAHAPSPIDSLNLFRNGLRMEHGVDYAISGNTITFYAGSIPQIGDLLLASYRYGDPSNPLGTLTAAQVICSGVGITTSATTLTQMATCTIPAGLLGNGDRIEVAFQYSHAGTASGFTGEVDWGATAALSRSLAASETAFVGRTAFGIYSGAQSWEGQSWGASSGFAVAAGSAAEDPTRNLTISFRGQVGAATDSVSLRNFTVTRYPAQLNP
jgi:hypothetical protein